MRPLTMLLVPAVLFAGQVRFARLGDFEGKVEVQLQAADPWMPAERNLPLAEAAWLRTGPASRLEVELDEGSAWRLGPDSQAGISDYSRLSTGQLVTLLSLDHGVAYFTGEPLGKGSLSLAMPGAQLLLSRGARLRLQTRDNWSEVAVIEGSVTLSSPGVEVEVTEGRTVRLDPADPSRLSFNRQVEGMELDAWSEERDKALYMPAAAGHVPQRHGLADLDHAGEWVQIADLGEVWKPKAPNGWTPFRNGRWRWYDSIGYTWISGDPWGWLPYHYGRWTRVSDLGWVWAPARNGVFKPGEVYWLRGARLAGWGPLAPGEEWAPSSAPRQFLDVNTTYASWVQDARLMDPAGFTGRPKEPVAAFALALPSPAFVASRLDAIRPVLRAGGAPVTPALAGVTYDPSAQPTDAAAASADPGPAEPPNASADPPSAVPPPAPVDIGYPAPVYTGIIVINPPENPDYVRRRAPQAPAATPPQTAATPPSSSPVVPRGVTAGADHRPPSSTPAPVPSPAPAPASPPSPPAVPRTQPGPPEQPRPAPSPQAVPVHVSPPPPPAPAPAPIPVSPSSNASVSKTPAAGSPASPKNQ